MRRSRVIALVLAAFIAGSTATGYAANSGVMQTLWPGDNARFTNLDWTCQYIWGTVFGIPGANRGALCNRESTDGGIQTIVTGDYVVVRQCKVTAVNSVSCSDLFRHKRNP
jgi:hypothetical protein